MSDFVNLECIALSQTSKRFNISLRKSAEDLQSKLFWNSSKEKPDHYKH